MCVCVCFSGLECFGCFVICFEGLECLHLLFVWCVCVCVLFVLFVFVLCFCLKMQRWGELGLNGIDCNGMGLIAMN